MACDCCVEPECAEPVILYGPTVDGVTPTGSYRVAVKPSAGCYCRVTWTQRLIVTHHDTGDPDTYTEVAREFVWEGTGSPCFPAAFAAALNAGTDAWSVQELWPASPNYSLGTDGSFLVDFVWSCQRP